MVKALEFRIISFIGLFCIDTHEEFCINIKSLKFKYIQKLMKSRPLVFEFDINTLQQN